MKRTTSSSLRLLASSSSFGARSAPLVLPRTSFAGLISSSSRSTVHRTRLLATAAKASSSTSSSPSSSKPAPRNADPEVLHEQLDAFAARIGFKWNNKKLLLQAFTHPSFSHDKEVSNQRLEYFGASLRPRASAFKFEFDSHPAIIPSPADHWLMQEIERSISWCASTW